MDRPRHPQVIRTWKLGRPTKPKPERKAMPPSKPPRRRAE